MITYGCGFGNRIRSVQIRAIENLTLAQVGSRVRVSVGQIRTPHVAVEIRRQVWDQALRLHRVPTQ